MLPGDEIFRTILSLSVFSEELMALSTSPAVNCPDFAVTVTAFL